MDTTADCYYNDRPRLAADLAMTVNKEILALVDAGCRYIQVDEPLFARLVEDALGFGMEGLERCFHHVPDHVTRAVHICCGYPDYLDDEDYRKADPQSYHRLAGDSSVGRLSCSPRHRGNPDIHSRCEPRALHGPAHDGSTSPAPPCRNPARLRLTLQRVAHQPGYSDTRHRPAPEFPCSLS